MNYVEKKNLKNILVLVAHTDDETLGLGGTIARHIAEGDNVFCASMTDGVGSRIEQNLEDVKVRANAALRAAKILGIEWIEGGSFPDNAMDTVSLLSVIKVIEKIKQIVKPNLIYTHSSADLNVDHRVLNHAVLTAFRPQPDELWSEIRTFEVPSATDYGHKSISNAFSPNLFIDITNYWDKKLAALKEYAVEMRESPHSRSYDGLQNLAKLRGNQSGLKFAEAFEVVRKIKR